jgi:hypothetical protein
MSRIDQYTLDLGDNAPRMVAYDSKTAKPYIDGERPKPKRRRASLVQAPRVHSASASNAARDTGISQALQNEREAWRALHDKELALFLIEKGAATFLSEDFRRWFVARGNVGPHHHNVWGAMWMAAARQGLVIKSGEYRHMRDVRSHARLTTEWMKPHGVPQL